MIFGKNTKAPFKAMVTVVAALYLLLSFFSTATTLNSLVNQKAEKEILADQQQNQSQLIWSASESLDAASGILHEAEISLLPFIIAFVLLFSSSIVLLVRTRYSRPSYKIFDFFRILPNAP